MLQPMICADCKRPLVNSWQRTDRGFIHVFKEQCIPQPEYPKTCELCHTQIESTDDAMWWHGYGNCTEITDEMLAQWEEESKS